MKLDDQHVQMLYETFASEVMLQNFSIVLEIFGNIEIVLLQIRHSVGN
jgi:hypothetical protein